MLVKIGIVLEDDKSLDVTIQVCAGGNVNPDVVAKLLEMASKATLADPPQAEKGNVLEFLNPRAKMN